MGSERGARAGAIIYSLLGTCKMHLIEPYAYFKYILDQLPRCKTDEQRKMLLPQFVNTQKLMRAYSQATWDV
jgi:transposase